MSVGRKGEKLLFSSEVKRLTVVEREAPAVRLLAPRHVWLEALELGGGAPRLGPVARRVGVVVCEGSREGVSEPVSPSDSAADTTSDAP